MDLAERDFSTDEIATRISFEDGRWTPSWNIDGEAWTTDGHDEGDRGRFTVDDDRLVGVKLATEHEFVRATNEPHYSCPVEVNLPEPDAPRERRRSVARVCIIGAESTGKTTLAAALAERYRTLWVPEYGAPYHHVGRGDPHRPWAPEEFTHIARIRDWLEEFLAGYADRVLFCDTDTFVTAVFYEVYMGTPSSELEEQARSGRYSLYLLCDVDTPFHRDKLGLRREEARLKMHRRYADYVRSTGCPWLELSGPHEERMRLATAAVDGLIS